MRRHIRLSIAILFLIGSACRTASDEDIIRKEFAVPSGAETEYLDVHPKNGNQWFGREGLRISIGFQFNEQDFERYKSFVLESENWNELPMPRDYIMRMGGIESSKEGMLRSFGLTDKPIPEEGSIYNPTIDQLYERFVKTLPLDISHGYYQCRTAGDNIMYKKKRIVKNMNTDLNDFMLAVLDTERKILHIKVSTKY